MKTLYDDIVSTTGTWLWKELPMASGQPHMVRIAAVLQDDDADHPMDALCRLISPLPGWPAIPPQGTQIHGIYQEDLHQHGIVLGAVLARMSKMLAAADQVVAHSAAFHNHLLRRAYRDGDLDMPSKRAPWVCTMKASVDLVRVNLESAGRWRWPKLLDAYRHFAGKALVLPSDPIARGEAVVAAVRRVHLGIVAARTEA